MIVPKTTTQPFETDLSSLTQEQQENILSTRYRSETDDYEVEFTEKYERKLLKEENKALKDELKAQRDSIENATDFADMKKKIKESKPKDK